MKISENCSKFIEENKTKIIYFIIIIILSYLLLIILSAIYNISFILGIENIVATIIFFISIFYIVIAYIQEISKEEPKEPSEPINNNVTKKIERAWKYDAGADKRIQQRLNYFMVAESMLLLSFVTAYSKDIREILIAISIAGITITSLWFIPNVRLLIQAHILERYLLSTDPIYCWHIKSVRRQLNTTLLIHNILPNSLIILWVYLLTFSLIEISVFEFATELLPYCLLILLEIRIILKIIIPGNTKEDEVLKKLRGKGILMVEKNSNERFPNYKLSKTGQIIAKELWITIMLEELILLGHLDKLSEDIPKLWDKYEHDETITHQWI